MAEELLSAEEIWILKDHVYMWGEISKENTTQTGFVEGFYGVISHPKKDSKLKLEFTRTTNDFSFANPTNAGEIYTVRVFGDYDTYNEKFIEEMQGRKGSAAYDLFESVRTHYRFKEEEQRKIDFEHREKRLEEIFGNAREIIEGGREND